MVTKPTTSRVTRPTTSAVTGVGVSGGSFNVTGYIEINGVEGDQDVETGTDTTLEWISTSVPFGSISGDGALLEGDDIALSFEESLSGQWYLDDVAIDGATAATLALGAVDANDAGVYSYVVTDSVSSRTWTFSVTLGVTGVSYDTDAQTYFTAVEAVTDFDLTAINGTLTASYVKDAINSFVLGLKSDGTWDAINQLGLLVGPRELAGLEIKLKGAGTITPNGLEVADYTANVGLAGDGANNQLSLGVNADAVGSLTDFSMWAWVADSFPTNGTRIISAFSPTEIYFGSTTAITVRANHTSTNSVGPTGLSNDFVGWSRDNSLNFDWQTGATSGNTARGASGISNLELTVFATSTGASRTAVRIAAYGAGTAVNLSQIRARLSTLLTALQP